MNIEIRLLEEKDLPTILNEAREAFYNLYVQGADEHLIINNLLKSEFNISQLNYVITVDEEVAGAIFYSKALLKNEQQENSNVVTLGPVFISPSFQGNKLGIKLIKQSILKVKELNYDAIFLYGFVGLYSKLGFESASSYDISDPEGNYPSALQVYKFSDLFAGKLYELFDFSTDENELAEFDKNFKQKQKKYQSSQDDFLNMLESFDK